MPDPVEKQGAPAKNDLPSSIMLNDNYSFFMKRDGGKSEFFERAKGEIVTDKDEIAYFVDRAANFAPL